MTAPDQHELRAACEAAAAAVRALRLPTSADRLDTYPLPDVLLWGLSDGCQDPVIGVIGAVRTDMDGLAYYWPEGNADAVPLLKEILHGLARRLDVALELLKRVKRAERRGHESSEAKDGAP